MLLWLLVVISWWRVLTVCTAGYLSPSLATKFRGEWHADGGLAQPVPSVPSFASTTMLPFFHADISPGLVQPRGGPMWYDSIPRLLHAAFNPGEPQRQWDVFHWGEQAALAWLEGPGRGAVFGPR